MNNLRRNFRLLLTTIRLVFAKRMWSFLSGFGSALESSSLLDAKTILVKQNEQMNPNITFVNTLMVKSYLNISTKLHLRIVLAFAVHVRLPLERSLRRVYRIGCIGHCAKLVGSGLPNGGNPLLLSKDCIVRGFAGDVDFDHVHARTFRLMKRPHSPVSRMNEVQRLM